MPKTFDDLTDEQKLWLVRAIAADASESCVASARKWGNAALRRVGAREPSADDLAYARDLYNMQPFDCPSI